MQQNVNQDSSWDIPSSPEPSHKDMGGGMGGPAGASGGASGGSSSQTWKLNVNNGTDLWEVSKPFFEQVNVNAVCTMLMPCAHGRQYRIFLFCAFFISFDAQWSILLPTYANFLILSQQANLRNGGAPPPAPPASKTPWGHTPTTNIGTFHMLTSIMKYSWFTILCTETLN